MSGVVLYCLLEDGSLAKYDEDAGTWTYPDMPEELKKGYARVISSTQLPSGYEIINNVATGLWAWRRVGSTAVPPPSIEDEVSAVFDSKEDVINDARQRFMLRATTQSLIQ